MKGGYIFITRLKYFGHPDKIEFTLSRGNGLINKLIWTLATDLRIAKHDAEEFIHHTHGIIAPTPRLKVGDITITMRDKYTEFRLFRHTKCETEICSRIHIAPTDLCRNHIIELARTIVSKE